MTTVLLDRKRHDRKSFDCGVNALNNYLQLMASQQSDRDNTRTFVLEDDKNPSVIIGYSFPTTPLSQPPLSISNRL